MSLFDELYANWDAQDAKRIELANLVRSEHDILSKIVASDGTGPFRRKGHSNDQPFRIITWVNRLTKAKYHVTRREPDAKEV
jgi:hypothetical protein